MGCFGSKDKLSKEDMDFLKSHTRYDEATIKEWYKGFKRTMNDMYIKQDVLCVTVILQCVCEKTYHANNLPCRWLQRHRQKHDDGVRSVGKSCEAGGARLSKRPFNTSQICGHVQNVLSKR
uniref:Neuronal calcium sensor 2 n=1 Tax=Schizaphis graminum TaxID=13262 RepID=A0A2S2NQ97_SCHGA